MGRLAHFVSGLTETLPEGDRSVSLPGHLPGVNWAQYGSTERLVHTQPEVDPATLVPKTQGEVRGQLSLFGVPKMKPGR